MRYTVSCAILLFDKPTEKYQIIQLRYGRNDNAHYQVAEICEQGVKTNATTTNRMPTTKYESLFRKKKSQPLENYFHWPPSVTPVRSTLLRRSSENRVPTTLQLATNSQRLTHNKNRVRLAKH